MQLTPTKERYGDGENGVDKRLQAPLVARLKIHLRLCEWNIIKIKFFRHAWWNALVELNDWDGQHRIMPPPLACMS